MKRECGPGLLSLPDAYLRSGELGLAALKELQAPSPWWYDASRHEIVRARDRMRWRVEDVPEFERSLRDRNNPEVDVSAIDRWVLEQSGRDR